MTPHPRADRYLALFARFGDAYDLDPRLLRAQVIAESDGNPLAMSHVGARGLAQFMPRTWLEWWDGIAGIQGPPQTAPMDPEAAIRAQAAYLRNLHTYFAPRVAIQSDLLPVVLAAYNWGMGYVGRVLRRNSGMLPSGQLPAETRAYVARILKRLGEDTPQQVT